jgi:hypothetical protein
VGSAHRKVSAQHRKTQTYMPRTGFESRILVIEGEETIRTLDGATTGTATNYILFCVLIYAHLGFVLVLMPLHANKCYERGGRTVYNSERVMNLLMNVTTL